MNKESNNFLSFLSGLGLGAVVGILFAPDSGVNTRAKLLSKLEKYKIQLQRVIEDLIHKQAAQMNGEMAQDSEEARVVEEAKEKAEKLMEEIESMMKQIK